VNRIILLGNGFDLAHGLETSYNQFINWVWKTEKELITEYCRNNKPQTRDHIIRYEDDLVLIRNCCNINPILFNNEEGFDWIKKAEKNDWKCLESKLIIKNKFIKKISEITHPQNWVDIEEEYFKELCICLKDESHKMIDNLNIEFKVITDLLILYLQDITINENQVYGVFPSIKDKISSKFNEKDFSTKYKNIPFNKEPKEILYLSFNYTGLISWYNKKTNDNMTVLDIILAHRSTIHIHGLLIDKKNPIIFGYGDEAGETYKIIEDTNKNEYLENMKSAKYSLTDNYKRLESFMVSDDYQIFIFGHSCGKSDRTLLKMLFEDENCLSIKIFYRNYIDDNKVERDNYSEVYKNISRHFSDKKLMRSKVVDKTNCQTLIDKDEIFQENKFGLQN